MKQNMLQNDPYEANEMDLYYILYVHTKMVKRIGRLLFSDHCMFVASDVAYFDGQVQKKSYRTSALFPHEQWISIALYLPYNIIKCKACEPRVCSHAKANTRRLKLFAKPSEKPSGTKTPLCVWW